MSWLPFRFWPGVGLRLDQPKRPAASAVGLTEVFGGPGAVVAGILFGVVDEAELERVHLEFFGELVHGDLEDGGAGGLAGRAHKGGDAEVHVDELLGDGVVLAVVQHLGGAGGVFGEVFEDGGVHDDVLLHGLELAVGGGGELDVVVGVGALADGAEHLVAVEHEFDGLADDARGHGGERHVRPGRALGAEAAAGVGALDADVVEGDVEDLGDRHLDAGDVLGGVVEVELFALPPGDGGVGLHGIVVLDGGDVGLVDGDAGLGEAGGDVAALVAGGLLAGLLGPAGFGEAALEVELGGLLAVLDAELRGGEAGLVEGLGDDDRDGLAVVFDVGVLEDGEIAAGGGLRGAGGELGGVEGSEDRERRREHARRRCGRWRRACRWGWWTGR